MSLDQLKAVATEGKSLKPVERIKLKIEGIQAQLAKAIPVTMQKTFTPERLTRLFWQEVRRIKHLDECTPESIATGLMTSAQLGIEIGVMGQGWLIPYFNSKKKCYEAQFLIGYKGLVGLARRSGEVTSIETHIVYYNDKFSLKLGINTHVEHEPCLNGPRGSAKLVYGVAHFRDGGHHFEWMSLADVEKIRAKKKEREDSPWATDYEQMVRKTLIRRMSNYLPLSIEFANALAVDQAIDEGKKASIDGEFVEIEEEMEKEEPPRIENKPAEQVPVDPDVLDARKGNKKAIETARRENKAQADKQQIPYQPGDPFSGPPQRGFLEPLVDKETGEIPELTAEQLLNRFAVTKDADVLDADATLIATIKDEEMRKDLTAYYMKRREELKS